MKFCKIHPLTLYKKSRSGPKKIVPVKVFQKLIARNSVMVFVFLFVVPVTYFAIWKTVLRNSGVRWENKTVSQKNTVGWRMDR